MQYLITLLEGIVSFLSPCMLPLLPVYVSFFAGEAKDGRKNVWLRAAAFVLGFTLVFCALGLFAGSVGRLLRSYRTAVNVICGAAVIVFGLSCLEVIRLPFFGGIRTEVRTGGVWQAFLFGTVYSVSMAPCTGAFLGSAVMLASASGSAAQGTLLLLIYSLGLGIPFILSAVLLDRLKEMFAAVKKHYGVINRICGVFLIVVGLCMMSGLMNLLVPVIGGA